MVDKEIIKAIKFEYENQDVKLKDLLVKFRDLVNYCIKAGLEKNISSRYKLIKEVGYSKAKELNLHTHCVISACEIACALLKNYRKAKRKNKDVKEPKVGKLFLKLDNQSYKLIRNGNDLYLRIPYKPKEFIYLKLKYGKYHEQFLNGNYKFGSVIVNLKNVIIPVRKEIEIIKPERFVAIDINEENITCVSNGGIVKVYDIKEVKTLHYTYYLKRKSICKKIRCRRLRLELLKKYSGREKRKKELILHKAAKQIVNDFGNVEFILENLKGIRNKINERILKVNKYNGKVQPHRKLPRKLIRRLNEWSFRKIQFFIEYKALWNGCNVIYLPAYRTSMMCPICGETLAPNGHREMKCKKCKYKNNRDIIACLNLLKMKGVVPPDSSLLRRTTDDGGENYGTFMIYVITLDIDDKNKINEVLNFLKGKEKVRNVLVRESSTKGYHVKVFIEYDEKLIDEIRSKFDDKIRYSLDKELAYKPKNVLFDFKVIDGKMYRSKSFRKLLP